MASFFKLAARKVRRDVIKSDPKHFNSFYSGDTGTTSNWLWESDEGLVEEDAFLDTYVFASPPSAAETKDAFSEILRAQELMPNLESASSEGLVCTEPSLPISTIPPNMVQMRGPMTYNAMDIFRNDKSIQVAAMKLTSTPDLWEFLKNTEAAVDLKNSCMTDYETGVDIFCLSGGSHGLPSTEEPGRFIKIMNWLSDKVLSILKFLNDHGQLPGAAELSEAVNQIEIMFEYKLKSSFCGAILAYLLVIVSRVLKAMAVGVKVAY